MVNRDFQDFIDGYMTYWNDGEIPEGVSKIRGYLTALNEIENGKIYNLEDFQKYYSMCVNGFDVSFPSQLKEMLILRNQIDYRIFLMIRDYPHLKECFENVEQYEEKYKNSHLKTLDLT